MRPISRIALLVAITFGAVCAFAQAPQKLPVTGNLGSILGTPSPYASVELDLYNCPAPVSVTGYMGIVQTSSTIQADASGNVNSTIWPNDVVTCNGTTGSSTYGVTYIVNGVPSSSVQCYSIQSTQGQWYLNGQQTPVTCGATPPTPTTGSFGNLTSTGFFQGDNGDFTGNLAVGGTLTLGGALTGTTAAFSGGISAASISIPGVFNCPLTSSLSTCFSQLPSGGNAILNLTSGTYAAGSYSPFTSACMSKPNVFVMGSGTPQFNAGNTALTGGTIIQGFVGICANNFTIANLGIDVGSAFIGGGAATDGLEMDGPNAASESGSDPILNGATLINLVALGAGTTLPVHAFLIEHYTGVNIQNLEGRDAQHCMALKSSNVNLDGFKFQGCSVDGLTMKGDAYTQLANLNLVNIQGRYMTNPGDTNGVQVVATESTGTTHRVSISNYTAYGLLDDLSLTNSSGVGAGALSDLSFSNLNFSVLNTSAATVSVPTCILSGGSATIANVQVNGLFCNINDPGQTVAPLSLDLGLTNSTLGNLTLLGGGFASDIEGNVTINGIYDLGAATSQKTIFSQASAATVLQVYNWFSNRGNGAFGTSVGASATIFPPTQVLNFDGTSTHFATPITTTKTTNTDPGSADTYNIFSNTGGGASYVQNNATGSMYAPFESVTSNACWIAGPWGTSDYSVLDCHPGTPVQVVKIQQGAPASSIFVDSSGNANFAAGTTAVYRCVGGTLDGYVVWKTSVCTTGGGATTDLGIRGK